MSDAIRTQFAVDVPAYLADLVQETRPSPRVARGLIYRALVRAAELKQPCPSGWVLATICAYDGAHSTVGHMKALEIRGLIRVQRYQRGRDVKIVATGKRTRPCKNTTPHWRQRDSGRASAGVGDKA